MANEISIITPVGMIGYGYPIERFLEVCDELPIGSFIIADAGSTDGGPYKLCFGTMTCTRDSYIRDFEPMLQVAAERGFRILLTSAGGHGSNAHVEQFVDLIEEISERRGYSFKVAKVYAEIPAERVKDNLRRNLVRPCGPVPELSEEEVDASTRIVAQMGAEPVIKALETGADIVISGRAYDPAPYAAVALMNGIDPAIAWHMGKICECGALCATPKGRTIVATVRKDSFDLTPTNPLEKCTQISVAAHTLYEKSRPDLLVGPGGTLDLSKCRYEQITPRTVRVSQATFKEDPYTVKLEGAKQNGFRASFICGIRDPILIRQIDTFLEQAKNSVMAGLRDYDPERDRIAWHVYGKNAVMGDLEPVKDFMPLEVGVVGEVLADTQERALQMGNQARIACLHSPYPGQMATSGNVGSPFTPMEQALGAFCEFNIYHLMPVDDPLSLFPITVVNIGTGKSKQKNQNGVDGHAKQINGHTRSTGLANGIVKAKEHKSEALTKPTFRELLASGRTFAYLSEVASIIRSKNAGPYELTLDVMFENDAEYEHVKHSGVLNVKTLAMAYNLDPKQVVTCMFFDPARAFKFTIPRPHVQAGFGETDMHGAQQYAPLVSIQVPFK